MRLARGSLSSLERRATPSPLRPQHSNVSKNMTFVVYLFFPTCHSGHDGRAVLPEPDPLSRYLITLLCLLYLAFRYAFVFVF